MTLAAAVLAVAAAAVTTRVSAAAGAVTTPAGPVSKQAALDSVARTVLLPAYADLSARAADLWRAAESLRTAPALTSLRQTQQAWRATLLAWRRTQSFAHGPVDSLGVYARIQFWPSRRQSIDRVLKANRPFDDRYLQELGANAVGLSALEVLLFDVRETDAARVKAFSGPSGDRRRRYLAALTGELTKQTRHVEQAWRGAGGYAAGFGAGGQQNLNLLVNDILGAIEAGAQGRLQTVIDKRHQQQFAFDLVEGGLSGTSQDGLLALLTGVQASFTGQAGLGLDDYLKQINPGTARRVEAQFQLSIAAVRAIGMPLERGIEAREVLVRQAHEACRQLEVLVKSEVASALGVTLTFRSTDGD